MAHPISEKMLVDIERLIHESPLDHCDHVLKRRDSWWCNPGRGVRVCKLCYEMWDNGQCYLCAEPVSGVEPVHFGIEVCRMGGSKVADTFIAPGCTACTDGVPLGDWGVGYLETLVDDRRTFIMFNRWTKDGLPDE